MDITEEEKEEVRIELMQNIIEMSQLIRSGYAGINSIGNVVDRRIIHDAIPIQENALLGTPEPKEL